MVTTNGQTYMYHKHLYFYHHCLSQLVKFILQDDNTVVWQMLSYDLVLWWYCCYDNTCSLSCQKSISHCSWYCIVCMDTNHKGYKSLLYYYMYLYTPAVYKIVVPNVSELSYHTTFENDYLDRCAYGIIIWGLEIYH